MPSPRADYTVQIVDGDGQPDMTVAVVGDQVVNLTGASEGDLLQLASGLLVPRSAAEAGLATQASLDAEATARANADATLVAKALFDANTVLKADADNTPLALTMAASTILARLASGSIVAATVAEVKELLGGWGAREFGSGLYYFPITSTATADGTDADGKGFLVFAPFPVAKRTTFDRIGTYCKLGQANTNVRVGLYSSVGGKPSALLVESDSLDSTVSTTLLQTTINLTLDPGLYWLGCVWQGAGATMPSITRVSPLEHRQFVGVAAANIGDGGNLERYWATSGTVAGTLPNPVGSLGRGNSSPIRSGFMRAA